MKKVSLEPATAFRSVAGNHTKQCDRNPIVGEWKPKRAAGGRSRLTELTFIIRNRDLSRKRRAIVQKYCTIQADGTMHLSISQVNLAQDMELLELLHWMKKI